MSWVDFIPFIFGALGAVTHESIILYDMVWKQRHNAGPKWDFDHEYERVWIRLKKVKWLNIVVAPIIVGAIIQLFWWGMAVAMEVLR